MKTLRIGEDVLAADGSRLGTVERLVVDEGAHLVTHLVVEERVLPLAEFRDAGPDGLATSSTAPAGKPSRATTTARSRLPASTGSRPRATSSTTSSRWRALSSATPPTCRRCTPT